MTEKGNRKATFFSVQYSIMKATLHNNSSPKGKKKEKTSQAPTESRDYTLESDIK